MRNLIKKMESMYWHKNPEWYTINEEKDIFELTDKAPERAKVSLDMFYHPEKYGIDD